MDQICRLKYRFVRCLDTKQWDELQSCFAEDGTADLDGRAFAEPAALVAHLRETLGGGTITMHQVHSPEIDLDQQDPDAATGRWYLQDKVIAGRLAHEGAAFYEDRYLRTGQGWRIAHTGYARTFALTWSLDDIPSLEVVGAGSRPLG